MLAQAPKAGYSRHDAVELALTLHRLSGNDWKDAAFVVEFDNSSCVKCNSFESFCLRKTNAKPFCGRIDGYPFLSPFSEHVIIQRALKTIGWGPFKSYSALWFNCEHYAHLLVYGVEWSEQSDFGDFGVSLTMHKLVRIGFVDPIRMILFGGEVVRNEAPIPRDSTGLVDTSSFEEVGIPAQEEDHQGYVEDAILPAA